MKPISISPVSLLLGALITFGCFLLMGQAGPGTPPGSWGPPKKSIVNLFEDQSFAIAPGASYVVYQVPPDRWLTVTGVSVGGGGGALRWNEHLGGVYTKKGIADIDGTHALRVTPAGAGSEVGWVFHPGSQVVIRNVSSGDIQVSSYALIGYETRD